MVPNKCMNKCKNNEIKHGKQLTIVVAGFKKFIPFSFHSNVGKLKKFKNWSHFETLNRIYFKFLTN